MVTTADFPQADRLERVGEVAVAVFQGHRTYEAIERFIGLDSEGRQGRYYRHTAELLGLIHNQRNYSVLTPLGEEYVTLSTKAARREFLAQCLLETPVFREALKYILHHHPSDEQLRVWFRNFYPGSPNTAGRRFATFFSYLRDADLVRRAGAAYRVSKYEGAVVKEKKVISEGIAGKPVAKTPENAPVPSSTGSIRYEVDAQKRERANHNHWRLVTAKSAFLDARGWPAYENPHIDLYTQTDRDIVIYEMKSIAQNNLLSQMRKAVAQLYEYRYIFTAPSARLCIVTNGEIQGPDRWLIDYLTRDRLIAYEWTEDFSNFHCSDTSKALLEQFAP